MDGTTRTQIRQNGFAIRELRKREGLTPDQLAIACEISTPHLRNIENENKSASVEHIARIAAVLHVSIASIRRADEDVA